jgi:hypothetical protein
MSQRGLIFVLATALIAIPGTLLSLDIEVPEPSLDYPSECGPGEVVMDLHDDLYSDFIRSTAPSVYLYDQTDSLLSERKIFTVFTTDVCHTTRRFQSYPDVEAVSPN